MIGLAVSAHERPAVTRHEQVEGVGPTPHAVLALLKHRAAILGDSDNHGLTIEWPSLYVTKSPAIRSAARVTGV